MQGFSILTVKADIDLVLNHVNLRNGGGPRAGFGGAIDIEKGTVTVNGGILSDNTSTHDGGSTVTLTSMSVVGNRPDNCEPVNTIAGCTG
jgi:hypothetical protein